MKRVFLSVAGAMLLGAAVAAFVFVNNRSEEDFFNDNVAALASGEGGVFGHCAEEDNSCIAKCPNCGAVYEAIGNHKGGSFSMSGVCEACSHSIN